jgi:glycosyltransferase involved in cell wall biosynthesis
MAAPVDAPRVVRIALDESDSPVLDETLDGPLLLVLSYRGAVVGEVFLPAASSKSRDALIRNLPRDVRERLARRQLAADFRRATRGACPPEGSAPRRPTVTVVVTTRDRPEELRACLESILALSTRPQEVVVVDGSVDGQPSLAVSGAYPVRYLSTPRACLAEARNRLLTATATELVALIQDDCRVDAAWLDGLDEPFRDPMLSAIVGWAGPLELATPAQRLFDAREASRRCRDGKRLDDLQAGWCEVCYRNSIFRTSALLDVGLFPAELGLQTHAHSGHDVGLTYRFLTAGYSILIDPGRVTWHRHPAGVEMVERALLEDIAGGLAVASRCLFAERDMLAAVAVIRSTVFGLWAAVRGMEARERRSARTVVAGVLRRAVRERGSLLRGLALDRAEHASRAPHTVPTRGSRSPARRSRSAPRVQGEEPPLTVIIPSYNRRDPLGKVLAALRRQSYSPELFDVLVVLDGSTDGSAELVRSLETPYELSVAEQHNRGLAAARNHGAREAREELLVFLDDDLVPETQFLAAHVAGHDSASSDHVVLGYCPPLARDGGFWAVFFGAIWDLHYRSKAQAYHRWTYADIVGGNCSVARSLVLESGGWDERFVRREDWEFGVRLLQRRVSFSYQPDARAWHHFDSTLATELRKRRIEGRDDVYFASKHPHVRGQLPLAAYAGAVGSRRGRLAFRHIRASERAAQALLPLASALEALRLRRQWLRLVDLLLLHAYFLGMAEALESPERLDEFLSPVLRRDLVDTLEVVLSEEGCLDVPPAAGALDLLVRSPHAPPMRVRALELEGQWDWTALEERVLQEAVGRRDEAG